MRKQARCHVLPPTNMRLEPGLGGDGTPCDGWPSAPMAACGHASSKCARCHMGGSSEPSLHRPVTPRSPASASVEWRQSPPAPLALAVPSVRRQELDVEGSADDPGFDQAFGILPGAI